MKNTKGFTLIELMLVMGLFVALVAIVYINASRPQISSSLNTIVSVLISDIRHQQLKSITGDSATTHGIYFETDKYTLFKGASYNPADPDNFAVTLTSGLEFSNIGFPSNTLLFEKDGSYSGYAGSDVSVTVYHSAGDEKVVTINKYGIPTEN